MNIPNRLKQAIDNKQAIIFIGSGLSARVFTDMGKRYPSWTELLKKYNEWSLQNDLINKTEYDMIDEIIGKGNLTIAAEVLRQKSSNTDFGAFFDEIFRNDNRFDHVHNAILDIPFAYILTTNYDAIIESAYRAKYNSEIPVYTWDQVNMVNKRINDDDLFLFKLHGTYDRADTVILAENDYRKLYHKEAFLDTLKSIFINKSILFVGFGYNDVAITRIISNIAYTFEQNNCMHYLLIEKNRYNELEKQYLLQNDRITVIEYDNPDGSHSEIDTFFSQLKATVSSKKKLP